MHKPRLILSLAALGSSLVLAISLALPASAAARTGSPGQPIATGTVTDASGHARSGAVVRLYAWPSDTVLQGLRPGQKVPTKLLATTTADSSGAFAFQVSPATLASAAVSSGNANLEADSGSGSWFFTRKATDPAPAVRIKISGDTATPCSSWTYAGQLHRAWGTVGQSYDPHATGVKQYFTYGASQDTTLGIGFSASGDVGTFSAAGTESVTSGARLKFETFGVSNVVDRTQFRMAKYSEYCPNSGTHYQARSNGWFGTSKYIHPAHGPKYPLWTCGTYHPTEVFTTENAKAVSWKYGLAVPSIGFDGYAQTGYDATAQVTISFSKTRQLCGTNGSPVYASAIIARK